MAVFGRATLLVLWSRKVGLQRLGRRERAQKAAEATAQPKVKPENETLKRKPPPPPAGKRTGVKKEDKGELGEVRPPQQVEAVAAVGDPGPPAKAAKGKRKRAEKASGHRDPPPPPSSSSSKPGECSEEERLEDDEPVETGSRGGILLREGPGRILPPLAADALAAAGPEQHGAVPGCGVVSKGPREPGQ